jgi:thymidylate synthase
MEIKSHMKTEHSISADSLGDAWLQCLELIINNGNWIKDDCEKLLELRPFYAHIRFVDRNDHILAEYADQDRINLMERKYTFCGILSEYKISYGKLLYDNNGVDQIDWVIRRLRSKRESKSATITLHRPNEEFLSCLSMLDFKIRDEELHVVAVYRSQNAFASQPGNMIAIWQIQTKVATALSCGVGSIELFVASLHIYERDLATAKTILAETRWRCIEDSSKHEGQSELTLLSTKV